jgi:hypothetical protein
VSTLEAVLISILGTIVLAGIVTVGVLLYRRNAQRSTAQAQTALAMVEALSANTESIDKYSEVLITATGSLKDLPRLTEGLGKLCAAQVVEITALRREIKALREAIFKKDDVRGFEMPPDERKDFAWRAQEMMQTTPGLTMESALARILEEEQKMVVGASAFELG